MATISVFQGDTSLVSDAEVVGPVEYWSNAESGFGDFLHNETRAVVVSGEHHFQHREGCTVVADVGPEKIAIENATVGSSRMPDGKSRVVIHSTTYRPRNERRH